MSGDTLMLLAWVTATGTLILAGLSRYAYRNGDRLQAACLWWGAALTLAVALVEAKEAGRRMEREQSGQVQGRSGP